ncbi:MAG: Arsenical pump rane protein [Gammaproteobacteria bacterium]|nr:Arsenical pump rane protein [Gammaproteobacteria bacterium]
MLATAGVIVRPFRLPEAVWAAAGALALVCLGLMPLSDALRGIGKGLDVYLFLTGMMLLAEVARETGLFDWLASLAASHARGSPDRLFRLIYAVGIVVTVFLSNDATAVVLTPAVAAVTRACKVAQPLPYLLICALIANAASFVLPISNPANLVIYGSQMPPLVEWVPRFGLPSIVAIAVTYLILKWTQRKALTEPLAAEVQPRRLSFAGRAAGWGIVLAALVLTGASALGWQLGLPTCVAGVLTLAGVAVIKRSSPWPFVREISWGVIPLVAGLFVLVEGLDQSGVIHALSESLRAGVQHSPTLTAASSGLLVGFISNLVNNLPAGLIAGTAVQAAHVPANVASAILIGVDVGPNLSVTGSLATILWLTALRRESVRVKGLDFLKLGLLVMPPTLVLSLGALLLLG